MSERHRHVSDLLSAAFLLRRPVTVTTADAVYPDMYVISVSDADEPPDDDPFFLLSATPDGTDGVSLWSKQITRVDGVADAHIAAADAS